VEAVIDKDLAAALLAHQLGAEALLMLTDVDAVYEAWGTPDQRPLREVAPADLRGRPFAAGSMKPKVEAACRFVDAGGRLAGIGRLEDASAILEGLRGTLIRPATAGVTLDFTSETAPAEGWTPFELPGNAPPPKPRI
jgi:carbamate kinase